MLAVFRVAFAPKVFGDSLAGAAKKILLDEANSLRAIGDTSAYRLPMHPWNWNWGSNSAVANNGIVLLQAYLLTNDKGYLDGAQQCLDYLLGKNPMDITYVTGFGYRSPRNPHHRPSESDFVDDPVPGMLVGGADNSLEDDYAKKMLKNEAPSMCYVDNDASFSTNEVTVYWNSPLIYILAAEGS